MHKNSLVLSAEELFEWRKKEKTAIPQRGGAKDFEPNGLWMANKKLEAFYQEHLDVLSEPRIEKRGNLVQGTWDPERKVVKINKTTKFWIKMGFVDDKKHCLYPEEALFLIESNDLELLQHDVPMCAEEAYSILLHPSSGIRKEMYQVYAHLRRLGFIVIRHQQQQLEWTDYEKKIGMDQYMTKKKKKTSPETVSSAHSNAISSVDSPNYQPLNLTTTSVSLSSLLPHSTRDSDFSDNHQSKAIDTHPTLETCYSKQTAKDMPDCSTVTLPPKRLLDERTTDAENPSSPDDLSTVRTLPKVSCSLDGARDEPCLKKSRLESEASDVKEKELSVCHISARMSSQEDDTWTNLTKMSFSVRESPSAFALCDFKDIVVPDIGGKDTVALHIPASSCLPPNTSMEEEYEDICMFDVEQYRMLQHPAPHTSRDHSQTSHDRLKNLEFSFAEWSYDNHQAIRARNWREWKEECFQQESRFPEGTPASQLWQGEVTPLLQPKEALSTPRILNKLSIIQTFQGLTQHLEQGREARISFDVYLPDSINFKKSDPGVPDFRVAISRGEEPPDILEVLAATGDLPDKAPLHWATVDCGQISFFVLEEIELAVHPSSLG